MLRLRGGALSHASHASEAVAGIISPGGVNTLLRPEIWEVTMPCVRDNEIEPRPACRYHVPPDVRPDIFTALRNVNMARTPTNGNGKCGLHAVFGWPDAHQEVKAKNHDALIRGILSSSCFGLQQKLGGAGRKRLVHVLTDIWPSYASTFFDEFGGVVLTPEASCFHRIFALAVNENARAQSREKYFLNSESCRRKDLAKVVLRYSLRRLFLNTSVHLF